MKLERKNLKNGKDVLNLTQRQINKLNKAFDANKGSTIKISKTQIHKIVNLKKTSMAALKRIVRNNQSLKKGASILSSIVPMATKFIPKIASTIGLSGLAGTIEGLTKWLIGSGCDCDNMYVVAHNKIPKLVEYHELLTKGQLDEANRAWGNGKHVAIVPTTCQQEGGFLPQLLVGTLASMVLSKLIGGKGMQYPQPVVQGKGMQYPLVPYVTPLYGQGQQKKNDRKMFTIGKEQPFQWNTLVRYNTLNRPLSNFDIDNWISFLDVKNFLGVYPRDEVLCLSGMTGFCICNLHTSDLPGSHWTAFNLGTTDQYFHSDGMAPTREFTMIAKGPYIYNSLQYQLSNSVSCGLFAIYWIHEISRGVGYYDVVNRFSMTDLDYYETFIHNWFAKHLSK